MSNASRVYVPYRPTGPVVGLMDHRLWTRAGAANIDIPTTYIDALMDSMVPRDDQGNTNMCVAYACAHIVDWWQFKLGRPFTPMSDAYIYARSHQIDNDTQEGTVPYYAVRALMQYGTVPYDQDPTTPEDTVAGCIASSPASLDATAATYRITAGGPVDMSNQEEWQAAILHAPIMISIPVYQGAGIEAATPDGQGDYIINPPPAGAQIIGGHMIDLYGWTIRNGRLYGRILNSWGASWGANGRAWFDMTHPINEAWSMTMDSVGTKIVLTIGQMGYTINGFSQEMDTAPIIDQHNRTLVPVRFVSEALGKEVTWNPSTQQVTIADKV